MTGMTVSGDNVVVNPEQLAQLANELQMSGLTVQNSVGSVTDRPFTAKEAGRRYEKQGTDTQQGLERIGNWLKIWSTATGATAESFGKSAVTYGAVDAKNAQNTNNATDAPAPK